MKTPVNNLEVYNFKPEPIKSSYPVTVTDENGAPQIVYQEIPDDTINQIMTTDMSLSSLLKAGVDPSRIKIDTTHGSKIDEVQNYSVGLSSVELPPLENEIENQN